MSHESGDWRKRRQTAHRNNAAEWVMWMSVAPLVLLLRVISFASSRHRG